MVRYNEALAQAESGVDDDREESLLRRFPPRNGGTLYLERPAVVVASGGTIVLWYLPGALNEKTQVQMWDSTRAMEQLLKRSITGSGHSKAHWRCQDEYFSPGSGQLQPGCINVAPAWFQLGHNVSASLQGPVGNMYLNSIARPAVIASAALRVMHPRQYWEGLTNMVTLGSLANEMELQQMPEKLCKWASVFSALSIVSNRETPFHRDTLSRMQWFDILTSVGHYSHARMLLPSLQIDLRYDSGVMVGMSGRAVRHGVHKVDGDRICWAWYMRDNLHDFTKTPRGGFAKFRAGDDEVA
ncbi:hypothetical protein BD769DRAFT_1352873 [Suillus cothurnatus]|nr:hypothetical protein BD769DRAFT_1366001 [Suillus cothurnatus]KAG2134996.1 hypothetical protein BD769DRAFT_1352873 [Suillus cothurnatus]